METCPACGHQNPVGALICLRCSTSLVGPLADPDGTVFWKVPLPPEHEPEAGHVPAKDVPPLGEKTILFYIDTASEPLAVEVVRQATLGRHAPTNRIQPRVDLTPYGATAKGVSRLHGVIRRTETGVVYEDLASSNGTRLNGVQLQPYTPYPVKPGDCLLLGQLTMKIYFR